MSTMKKMLICTAVMASMFVALNASAGTVTLAKGYTNNVKLMVMAPVIDPAPGALRTYAERTATNTVTAGELRRQGSMLIVAANSGTTATSMTTTTNVIGNVTNVVVAATPIVVPESGLSAADGTVYWLRVPKVRKNALVKVGVGDGTVTLSTQDGGELPVTTTTLFDTEFSGFNKGLYASQSTYTNVNTISIIEW